MLPPPGVQARIDELRRQCDPSFQRWMPHINLVYGFIPAEHFDTAAVDMERVVRHHGPIEVCLSKFEVLEHARSASLVLVPDCDPSGAIVDLQRAVQGLFPACVGHGQQGDREYWPHLTVGQFQFAEEARRWKSEAASTWEPLTFVVDELACIARAENEAFTIRARVPLATPLRSVDTQLLVMLAACSGARAFAVGSAFLLGKQRPLTSDLDVLLVSESDADSVFRSLEALPCTWSRRAEGKFPLLQQEMQGVRLDIQHAASTRAHHPFCWKHVESEDACLAASALRDVHAVRRAVLRQHGLEGWRLFQQALLVVKSWAGLRGIYGNALGYLGGFSWSLLLADTLIRDGDADYHTTESLVGAMWRRFATWHWSLPVPPGTAGATPGCPMQVYCPTEPLRNSARNVTAATLTVLQEEFLHACTGAHPVCSALREVLASYAGFIRCEARREGPEALLCSAWLEARLMALLRDLDGLALRPFKAASGLFLLGVAEAGSLGQPVSWKCDCNDLGDMQVPGAAGSPATVNTAIEAFRTLVSRGEWRDCIEVQLESAQVLEARLTGVVGLLD